MKKSQNKTDSKATRSRKYNNTSRAAQSAQTAKSIIEALVALLVERRGGDVGLGEVAQKTGISQRTIFRFFKSKEHLHSAMDEYLFSYLQASAEQMQSLNFAGFAKNAFKLFDRHESLTLAYLLSPFGREARILFRRKLSRSMIAAITKEKKLKPTPEQARRLAVITSLVNAKIWFDIKSDHDLNGEQIADSIEWAIKTLLEKV